MSRHVCSPGRCRQGLRNGALAWGGPGRRIFGGRGAHQGEPEPFPWIHCGDCQPRRVHASPGLTCHVRRGAHRLSESFRPPGSCDHRRSRLNSGRRPGRSNWPMTAGYRLGAGRERHRARMKKRAEPMGRRGRPGRRRLGGRPRNQQLLPHVDEARVGEIVRLHDRLRGHAVLLGDRGDALPLLDLVHPAERERALFERV